MAPHSDSRFTNSSLTTYTALVIQTQAHTYICTMPEQLAYNLNPPVISEYVQRGLAVIITVHIYVRTMLDYHAYDLDVPMLRR